VCGALESREVVCTDVNISIFFTVPPPPLTFSQPHLLKLFDAVARLHFDEDAGAHKDVLSATGGASHDLHTSGAAGFAPPITAMLSPEGEVLHLSRPIKPRGQAEDWLGHVESGMKSTLRKAVSR
jgi:hypothetical protein